MDVRMYINQIIPETLSCCDSTLHLPQLNSQAPVIRHLVYILNGSSVLNLFHGGISSPLRYSSLLIACPLPSCGRMWVLCGH